MRDQLKSYGDFSVDFALIRSVSLFHYFQLLSIYNSDMRLKVKQASCHIDEKSTCHCKLLVVWNLKLCVKLFQWILLHAAWLSRSHSRTEGKSLSDQPQSISDQQEPICGEVSQRAPQRALSDLRNSLWVMQLVAFLIRDQEDFRDPNRQGASTNKQRERLRS